jgi:pyruvate,orthophosphate dikinase
VAIGEIAFDEARARSRHAAGAAVVLLRQDAETSDIAALEIASGLLTARGARTSHAAVVARQLGKVCLVGCDNLRIDLERRIAHMGEHALAEGAKLTLDGNTGAVYGGAARTMSDTPAELLRRLLGLRADASPTAQSA